MVLSNSKIIRLRSKVKCEFPNATVKRDNDGMFYISNGGEKVCGDYLIPSQKTEGEAWYWVSEVIKIDKNIQRTHPNRMDIGTFEKKFDRISKRNKADR